MSTFEIKGWCPGALRPMMSGDGLLVRVRPHAGRLTPDQAAGIARLSSRYGNGIIDLSSRANLQLRGISEPALPEVWSGLSDLKLLDPDERHEAERNVMVSPMWETIDPSFEIAQALEAALATQRLGLPAKFGFSVDCGKRHVLATLAADYAGKEPPAPIAVAIQARGGRGLARSTGLPDELFQHDGQITKRPFRALALSALAPMPDQRLWDIGAGSGSISVEWALCGGSSIAVERRADRVANIRANAEAFGLAHRMQIAEGTAPEILASLPKPDAVFIGGGLNAEMFNKVEQAVATGTRFVAHAVTLESQALLYDLQAHHGGDLMRTEISFSEQLGSKRGWRASRSIVQWVAEL